MKTGRCACKKLCALSFGLALGITVGLCLVLWTVWTINYGPTHMMTMFNIPVPTMNEGLMCALWGLIKGFVLGFFIALFYNLISCCCPCCKKCACKCCAVDRPEISTLK